MRLVYMPQTIAHFFTLNECLSWVEGRSYSFDIDNDDNDESSFWWPDGIPDGFPDSRNIPIDQFSLTGIPDFLYGQSLDEEEKEFLNNCGISVTCNKDGSALNLWQEKQAELIESAQLKLLLSLKEDKVNPI